MSGIRARSLVSGVLLAFALSVSGAEENEHIAACNLKTSSEARIDCLEDAIRSLTNGAAKVANETLETSASEPGSEPVSKPETGSQVTGTAPIGALAATVSAAVDIPVSEAPPSLSEASPSLSEASPSLSEASPLADSAVSTEPADSAVSTEPADSAVSTNSTDSAVSAVSTDSADSKIVDTTSDDQVVAMTTSKELHTESAEELPKATESEVLTPSENEVSSEELERFGQEQLNVPTSAVGDSDNPISAQVVSFDFVAFERLRVRLENGQVWRQTDADRPKLSRNLRKLESFDVEMWKTGLGGYRMKILPIGRTVRVKRLR